MYCTLLAQAWPADQARTAVFVALVSANARLILPSRSLRTGWRAMFSRLPLVTGWIMAGTLLALLLAAAVPPLALAQRFAPLSMPAWLAALGLGLLMLMPMELVKRRFAPRHRAWRPQSPGMADPAMGTSVSGRTLLQHRGPSERHQILDGIDHQLRSDSDQQQVVGDTYIPMTRRRRPELDDHRLRHGI